MDVVSAFNTLEQYLNQQVIGQQTLVQRLLIALLADGHLLVEGAPGLAKTRAINQLAHCIEGSFHRIQFTPDLLPADLTGTEIYRPQQGSFEFQKGPIFHNLILADEINRAPAKVQSALLEAMAERQVTVGKTIYPLADMFLVMATQNPIEQEGTYPLPEAQLDRFLMKVDVTYPNDDAELAILRLSRSEAQQQQTTFDAQLTQAQLHQARQQILELHLDESLERYMVALIMATRHPEKYDASLQQLLMCGVSPRATIALERCARAHAWLNNRDFVTPDDIHSMAYDVLRHRLFLSYQAEASGVTADEVIDKLIELVPVP